jgi:hypothetical protein
MRAKILRQNMQQTVLGLLKVNVELLLLFLIYIIEKNGKYERYKARIVGYQQRKNVDFFASFSPTAPYVTIRLVLALNALPHWYGVDLDATGAFISAPLPPEEQVYLKGIPGKDLPKGKCLRLKKTIYGLVQAPLSYFKLCKEVYAKVGLRQLDCDECLREIFSKHEGSTPSVCREYNRIRSFDDDGHGT